MKKQEAEAEQAIVPPKTVWIRKQLKQYTLPLKDYASQLEELDDLRKKVDDFSDGWQRERAEFANYRKRITRDQDTEKQNSKLAILRKYLDIHDDLELAIKNMPEHVKSDAWVNGIHADLPEIEQSS